MKKEEQESVALAISDKAQLESVARAVSDLLPVLGKGSTGECYMSCL